MSTMSNREILNALNSLKVKFKGRVRNFHESSVQGTNKVESMRNSVVHLERDITQDLDNLINKVSGQAESIGKFEMKGEEGIFTNKGGKFQKVK